MNRITVALKTLPPVVVLLLSSVYLAPAQDRPPAPVVITVEDASRPAKWKSFQFRREGGETLRASMPTEPRAGNTGWRIAAGEAVTMTAYTFYSSTETARYYAFYADGLSIPAEGMTGEQKKMFYDALWGRMTGDALRGSQGADQGATANPLERRKVTVNGREGVEQDFSVGAFQGRARMVYAAGHAYAVLAVWGRGTPDAQIDAFFDSFEIGGESKVR